MKILFINLISFYQTYLSFDRGLLSLFAPGGACKYSITCSEFTKQMIQKYGVVAGILMGFKRLWRCR